MCAYPKLYRTRSLEGPDRADGFGGNFCFGVSRGEALLKVARGNTELGQRGFGI